jgi:hypothetical protein
VVLYRRDKMDESYADFSQEIHYVGTLQGSELVDSALFTGEEEFSFRCGVGSRVNLYVDNNIDYIEADAPQYGLIIEHLFSSFERKVVNGDNNFWKTGISGGQFFSAPYQNTALELSDASPSNPLVRADEVDYRFLALPNKIDDGSEGHFSSSLYRPYLAIPIISMGDYLRVRFYSMTVSGDPYEYGENDFISVWAHRGHDAVGGNFPR